MSLSHDMMRKDYMRCHMRILQRSRNYLFARIIEDSHMEFRENGTQGNWCCRDKVFSPKIQSHVPRQLSNETNVSNQFSVE